MLRANKLLPNRQGSCPTDGDPQGRWRKLVTRGGRRTACPPLAGGPLFLRNPPEAGESAQSAAFGRSVVAFPPQAAESVFIGVHLRIPCPKT
jgi:hypothetical protein